MTEQNEMRDGLVSIVICAYNNWPDLEMTIQSALLQSYRPLEVIVVDNSSTDATPEEVPKRFSGRVGCLRQPNRGCAAAYNAGFAVARGEFLQFVNGDDVLAPNKVAKQVEVFRTDPNIDIVYGDIRKFQTQEGLADWTDSPIEPDDDMLARLIAPRGRWLGLNALGVLFRRRACEKVGAWDESLYIEDTDYWLRAAWVGCRFGHSPGSPMGFRRLRRGQKTENISAMLHGAEAVWDKALGYVTREPYRSLLAQELAQRRFHLAVCRHEMSRREALAKLSLARSTNPKTVSPLSYAFGWATVVVPGGSALARSPRWRPIRRFLVRLCRYDRDAQSSAAKDLTGRVKPTTS